MGCETSNGEFALIGRAVFELKKKAHYLAFAFVCGGKFVIGTKIGIKGLEFNRNAWKMGRRSFRKRRGFTF
jgi:hypothetical protein